MKDYHYKTHKASILKSFTPLSCSQININRINSKSRLTLRLPNMYTEIPQGLAWGFRFCSLTRLQAVLEFRETPWAINPGRRERAVRRTQSWQISVWSEAKQSRATGFVVPLNFGVKCISGMHHGQKACDLCFVFLDID